MEINIKQENKTLIVAPNGRLDSGTAGELEDALNQNIKDDINELIIDCSDIDFISSKGLRILVGAYKRMEGKTMSLHNPNPSVKEVLNLSGLLKVFTVK